MATTLTSVAVTAPSITATKTSGSGLTLQTVSSAVQAAVNLAIASTAGNVNICFAKTLSVTSGTPYTINLSTGTDEFGNTIGMVHVSAVLFVNQSTTTAQIFTIGAGTNPVLGTDQFIAQANGGCGFILNPNPGYTVTGSSADTLTVTLASGTSVAALLIVLGRSA